ncbi:DNA polymerase III subunit gamma/tau [Spongiibacter marinus]|uniref:DNA polymerase III subunit gamma/tau n=1 Tax=Spongiibacter marinus TaxID=354246 RepID=UPI0035BE4140
MTYQVLARKWRPKSFREMAGQSHVLKALINALDHDRLHHAYLFTGTRGVGKTTIARILARCLNCEQGVSSEPCGQCQSCVAINEGRFVDLIEVDAASRTKVEDTRELLDNVQYTPTQGRYKVYLIDEVHMLSASSFNALLKTLEEPPPHVKFLLATTDPQKIPATILSRCLQFSLKNLSPERVVEYLKQILEKELISFDEAALWLLGRAADGSMRDALSLTDQAIAFGSGKLGEHDVRQMLGTIDHGAVYRLISALSKRDGAELLAIVAELAELGVDFAGVANELLVVLHRIAIAQTVPEGLDNSLGDKQNVTALAGELSAEEVQFYYQMALQGRRDLNLAPELRGGLEMLLLRMVAFKPEGVMAPPSQPLTASASPEGEAAPVKKPPTPSDAGGEPEAEPNTAVTAAEPAPIANEAPEQHSREDEAPSVAAEPSKPEQASAPIPPQEAAQNSAPSTEQIADVVEHEQVEVQRPRSDEPPVATASAPEEAVAAAPSVELADLDARLWREQFDAFALPGMLGSIASHCQLAAKEGSRLQFVISQGNATLLNDRHIERLQEALADYFGQALKVAIDIGEPAEETPAEYRARRLQERLVVARQAIESDPLVQEIIAEFSAELDLESISLPEKRRQD